MKDVWRRWIYNGKPALMAIIPGLIFLAFPHQATAQQDPGACFMVTSSGKTINLGSLCGTAPAPPESGVFRVPIKRRVGRTPVIDVTFNGGQTFEMILDTGASGTLITLPMASALKLKATGTMEAQIADGSLVQFMTGQVKSVAVAGAVVNNIEVAIAPRAGIGLLGHDFFDKYDVKILEKVVEFHRR
jgi:predicted aspartyl protease